VTQPKEMKGTKSDIVILERKAENTFLQIKQPYNSPASVFLKHTRKKKERKKEKEKTKKNVRSLTHKSLKQPFLNGLHEKLPKFMKVSLTVHC
jgi:hypothetical protein